MFNLLLRSTRLISSSMPSQRSSQMHVPCGLPWVHGWLRPGEGLQDCPFLCLLLFSRFEWLFLRRTSLWGWMSKRSVRPNSRAFRPTWSDRLYDLSFEVRATWSCLHPRRVSHLTSHVSMFLDHASLRRLCSLSWSKPSTDVRCPPGPQMPLRLQVAPNWDDAQVNLFETLAERRLQGEQVLEAIASRVEAIASRFLLLLGWRPSQSHKWTLAPLNALNAFFKFWLATWTSRIHVYWVPSITFHIAGTFWIVACHVISQGLASPIRWPFASGRLVHTAHSRRQPSPVCTHLAKHFHKLSQVLADV